MIPQSQTLILTLTLSSLFSSAAAASSSSRSPPTSPSPSPSPAKAIMSDPIGFLRHAPPLKEIFRRRPPPPPPLCPSDHIDCLERHRSHRHERVEPPQAKSEFEKLNFGKKIGLVFAAAAVLLQVVFGGFLIYKRIQLKKLDRRGDQLVLASGSS